MVRIFKKFNLLLDKTHKKKLTILFFMMLVGAVLEVVGVSMMLPLMTAIMDENIIASNALIGNICAMLHIDTHQGLILFCIAALIFVFVAKDLFLILQYYVQVRFVTNNRFATQCRLLHLFLLRPYEYYLSAETSEILRIINYDVGQTYALLTTLLGFLTESVISVALIITIFIIEPMMSTFVALVIGVTMLIITKSVKPILTREGLSQQRNNALVNKWIIQATNGIKEVKVGNKESFFEENYNQSGQALIRAEKWNTVFSNIPRLMIEMTCICSMLLLFAILILMGRDIASLIPAIGAFAMAAVKLMPSANRIVSAFNAIAYQEPALNKMLENLNLLEQKGNTVQSETENITRSELTVNHTIELKGISYSYPNTNKEILSQADMLIPVGKSVGIVGTSGAGKTTAVDILLGLLNPKEGYVLTDGVDIMENYAQWLTHLSYIPQSIFMLDDTIRANVAFGVSAEEQDDEQIWKALEEAKLADFVRTLPDGLETSIGERGVRLSGGQRQRIGIARALYTNPKLLIFDEATSALDNETEAAIMESINSLHGKKTMIIIAHRLQTIEGCDIVYRVEGGKISREK